MKIRCTNCNAAYAVDDSKVEGKKFGFECPKCGESVVIDNRKAIPSSKAFAAPVAEKPGIDEPEADLSSVMDEFDQKDDLPDFDAFPAKNNTIADPELPSFGEDLSESEFEAEKTNETESAAEELDYDNFEDEIEPEIDLSVLQSPAPVSAESDNDFPAEGLRSSLVEEDLSAGLTSDIETIPSSEEEDESITIDLNSLDIDLSEPEEIAAGEKPEEEFAPVPEMDGEMELPDDFAIAESSSSESVKDSSVSDEFEDESITLDLDSLDIALEESDEIHPGESLEDESRLSIDDAGLTIDDLELEKAAAVIDDLDDENLHISLDDVNTEFGIKDEENNNFNSAFPLEDSSSFDDEHTLPDEYTSERLPEVDLERFGSAPSSDFETSPAAPVEDQFLDIESKKGYQRYEGEIGTYDADKIASSGGGYINFSVDYAFHYSRLTAVLRILGLYFLTFIPHIVVCTVYAAIAAVTGTINWLLILFTGEREKDFSLIQEQAIRYALSIYASMLNVTEDKPVFGGKKNVDYQLQFAVVYPPKYSRILSFLRLSVVGILVAAFPHILMLSVLSIGMSLIAFGSLIYTIFMGHWPSLTFDFMIRYLRYCANVAGYVYGLVDTYPSFRFE